MKAFCKVVSILALHCCTTLALAQSDYPSRPIKLVVPYGPGGTPDIHARLYAEHLGRVLHQTVVVENKVGASGIIGAQAVSSSARDGYTVLWAANSLFGINPFVFKKIPYTLDQFEPVSNVAQVCFAFVARPSLGVADMKGLVAFMTKNPDKLNFANSGIGNQPHLIWERLLAATGTKSTMIVFKSSPESFVALVGGFADAYVAVINAGDIQNIKAGKIQGLATTCKSRVPQLPDVPTMTELGFSDFVVYGTYQLYVPKGVPPDIIDKLARATETVKADRDYVSSLERAISSPASETSPTEFARWLDADRRAWSAIAAKAKITVE